jgi:transposase InsO family protein
LWGPHRFSNESEPSAALDRNGLQLFEGALRRDLILVTIGESHRAVLRESEAELPNQRWIGDTTELRIGESGRLFLAAILDLHRAS